jgi:hypothetical protein
MYEKIIYAINSKGDNPECYTIGRYLAKICNRDIAYTLYTSTQNLRGEYYEKQEYCLTENTAKKILSEKIQKKINRLKQKILQLEKFDVVNMQIIDHAGAIK